MAHLSTVLARKLVCIPLTQERRSRRGKAKRNCALWDGKRVGNVRAGLGKGCGATKTEEPKIFWELEEFQGAGR